MILTVDIGNSYITIGGYEGDRLAFVSDIVSDPRRTRDQYMVEIKNMMELNGIGTQSPEGAVIGSVVPELTSVIAEAVERLLGTVPIIVGPGIKSGINIRIENPAQLGADIFAGAVAAAEKFGGPCIICNLGTATVMSVLDANKVFQGVVIAAGVGTTQEAFTKYTALLPHVNIDPPKHVIGKNSARSVQSGLVFGTAAMIDGLVKRIEEELGQKARVLATGKICKMIIPYCETDIEVEEYLILDGLKIIYDKNVSR